MNIEKIVSPNDLLVTAYNEFVDASPQGILYSHTWWLEALAPGRYEILVLRENARIVAAWPLVYRSEDRRTIGQPVLTQKLGVLLEPMGELAVPKRISREIALVERLLESLPTEMLRFDQGFHENFGNWLPFYWRDFRQTTKYTYIFPSLSAEELPRIWEGMHKSMRKVIRAARRDGLRVKETDDIEAFYRLNRTTFDRQGTPIRYSQDTLERIANAAQANGGLLILIAEDAQGRAHSGVFRPYDEQCAVGLAGGSDYAVCHPGAKSLAEWEAIERLADRTARFDFEGSMMRNVELHVRRFGGTPMGYFRISFHRKERRGPPRGLLDRFASLTPRRAWRAVTRRMNGR